MAVIDCSTFQNCEIDALYSDGAERELDDEASAAVTEHAASCAACAARLERLRGHRGLVLSVAVEAVPNDFEARIMAAVDASLAKRATLAAAPAVAASAGAAASPSASAPATGGAKILRFMARPSFAVAATFALVLSGAAFMTMRAAAPMRSLATSSDEAPAAYAASAASPSPVPAEENAPSTVAQATATAASPPPPAAIAMAPADPGVRPPASMAMAKAGKPSAGPPVEETPALRTAKALASAGRCTEALPKLEALSASHPEADLHAARCIAKTRGCAAAQSRFDKAAQTNAGTEIGTRAQLEGAKCYQSTGDVVAARKRLEAAKDEGMLSDETAQALDVLERASAPNPGTPSAGAHASPKAMPAPRAAEPSSPAKR